MQEKLEQQIYNRVKQTGMDCNLIVMHPKTWIDLFKEVINSDRTQINKYEPLPMYRGIKVLRSLDMTEGLFEVH